MADEEKKSGAQDWSTRAGSIKAGSIEDMEKGKRAIVVNAEGKENIVEAYGEKNVAKLEEAAASDKPMVFRGPMYMKDGVSHLMINHTMAKGEPRPELTEEQKQARAEAGRAAALERDASRIPVKAGSVEDGGKVTVEGVEVTAAKVGRSFTLDKDSAKDIAERFAGSSFKAGDEIAYANYDAAELKAALETEETPAP